MLPKIVILPARSEDVPNLASLRGGGELIQQRIQGYIEGTYSPSFALEARAVFIAKVDREFAGYIAGHRTTRHQCQGELQWLNAAEKYRGKGVADALLKGMFEWFLTQEIRSVCVNVAPQNEVAIKFYKRHGASELNEHWLIWTDVNIGN